MKPIKIKHFHRVPLLMKVLMLIALPVCLYFLVIGIIERIAALTVIGAIGLFCAMIGAGFLFNYGIKITPRRVTLMNQRTLKMFRYEDVVYIKIVFRNKSIEGTIKDKYQPAYTFCFDGINLSTCTSLFPSLWISGLKLTKKFVDKSIASLSTCEKVNIQNLYTPPKK